jgi:hypothetical protein
MNLTPRREWASSVLDIDPSADLNVVRKSLLEIIRRADFEPEPSIVDAASILGIDSSPRTLQSSTKTKIGDILKRNIAAFTVNYWEIEPQERRRIWESLAPDAEMFPNHRRHLEMLKNGLSATFENRPQESTEEGATKEIWNLFQAGYPASHTLREQVFAEYYRSFPEAKSQFQRVDPNHLTLLRQIDPALVERIQKSDVQPTPRASSIQFMDFKMSKEKQGLAVVILLAVLLGIQRLMMSGPYTPQSIRYQPSSIPSSVEPNPNRYKSVSPDRVEPNKYKSAFPGVFKDEQPSK